MGKKILVVEDEQDVLTFLVAVLKDNGYEAISARDGMEGLELARSEKPDLITLDLQMPRETGTGFYRKLSRDKVLSGIPVIIISGVPGRHLAVKKPAAVFDKPIDPDELIAAIKEAIG